MTIIEPVTTGLQLQHARQLFTDYGAFLLETQGCGNFDPAVFLREIDALPAPYRDRNGDVLLASIDGEPAACIAYRVGYNQPPTTCEIKRLYVRPAYRGLGLARTLVAHILDVAPAHGYTRIVLDTDLVNMAAAALLYQTFGFQEYGKRAGNIAFFSLHLT